jgi:hypothetical protein
MDVIRPLVMAMMFLVMPPVFASQVVPSELKDVASRFETVLKVRVKSVTQIENRMILKDGSEGPVTSFEKIITAEVLSELLGEVENGEITVKFNMPVLNKYDENGNVQLSYSIEIPGTALEYSIEKDQEYIFCFGSASTDMWKAGAVPLMRAEKTEMESAVLEAIAQVKSGQ